ncbi:Calcineurin-like phosphoesterase [Musa troglodytarum]|uniref:Calcineurin-like phosphoesterase n=1 Tax=Musa troglodytarum TaxID=320322 RepID=A0A9E7KGW0_9LILI|nr:Calcineurin-like phosphoesterase [Musa troglodytarum]
MLSGEPSGRQMIPQSAALRCFLVLLLASATLGLGERLGAKECEDLGFTGLALCSDCNTLGEYVKDKGASSSSQLGYILRCNFRGLHEEVDVLS